MSFLPNARRRPFRLLAAATTAIAATALTISTAAAATPAPAATAAPVSSNKVVPQLQAVGLASTIALSNCSASLVRYPSSLDTDRAMMLTNGHCYEGGFLAAGQVLVNRASSRTGKLLNANGTAVATLKADLVLYATMTGTDVTLYRLNKTFAQIRSTSGGLNALTISSSHPVDGRAISIPSGYWKTTYSCAINGFVGTLREDRWTWHDSIRYLYPNSTCQTIGGTSGSPIVDNTTLQLVGVNNTSNEQGQACTLDNPCEVNADGSLTYTQGQNYGQETYWFTTCLTSTNTIDLNKTGCLLTKP
ncbi:S1 family peptidase [Jatrophihabitans sp.]|uniref:S1 family peptidase n=1 Tax=Jatrophihabitans sp. TaxID=1932789 RepID=UPI002C466DA5|nr:serine protease [Jatrophihabitans sp.]